MADDSAVQMNPDQQAERLIRPLEELLLNTGVSPEEVETTLDIAGKFAAIAAEQLNQQPGFQATEKDAFIAFDTAQCEQCLDLFMAAVQHAALRSWEIGLRGEIKSVMLQSLAQDVFLQAKQVVATTVGEHLTPDLQFPMEQLVGWMTQAAESALMYYISEYEKQNGPILGQDPASDYPDYSQAPTSYEGTGSDTAPEPPSYSPPAQPQSTTPEHAQSATPPLPRRSQAAPAAAPAHQPNYDKWAALALFVTTLPDAMQSQWLGLFGEPEQAVLRHYMDAQHVLAERDVTTVTAHLNDLKQFLREGTVQADYRDRRAMQAALQAIEGRAVEDVLWLAKFERPAVQRYLQVLVESNRRHNEAWLNKAPRLTPDLKACIADFLVACL